MGDEQKETTTEGGLSAYVDVHDDRGDRVVVLCRACGLSSPPLAAGADKDWFQRHAAEDLEEHHQWRTRRSPGRRDPTVAHERSKTE